MDEAKEKGRYRTYYDAITSFISISQLQLSCKSAESSRDCSQIA